METRIFIVEDHVMLREALRTVCGRCREVKVVGEAGTGVEAREGVQRLTPDIVLLDYRLPDVDGLALLAAFRELSPRTRVLVISGTLNRALVRACLAAGAAGFLSKEGDGQEVITALRAVMAGECYLSPKAVNFVVEGMRPKEDAPAGSLTGQELAVLRGIAAGKTYKEIAMELDISVKSVETYRSRLVRKTGHRSKVSLARFATEHDLVVP